MTAADYLPERLSLASLKRAAELCQGCDLYKRATQTVFGEGLTRARVILIGEQPGDSEDIEGRPFVGPAGKLLDQGLQEAGIERSEVYITNAVKHFKWQPRGKRRLHKKPDARELAACQPWLEAEFQVIKPLVTVCLGATAAQQLLGRSFRITKQRGEFIHSDWSERTLATWHPSAVLRAPDKEDRDRKRDELFGDLRKVAQALHSSDSLSRH